MLKLKAGDQVLVRMIVEQDPAHEDSLFLVSKESKYKVQLKYKDVASIEIPYFHFDEMVMWYDSNGRPHKAKIIAIQRDVGEAWCRMTDNKTNIVVKITELHRL